MESKQARHTPGPWGINVYGTSNQQPKNFDVGPIGYVDGVARVTGEANANLIAAAPDMLEALKKAKTCQASMNSDVVAVIDAAIAKAKGE